MPATNSAIEATKRNRGMMRGPSLFNKMKQYQRNASGNLFDHKVLSLEERKILEERMEEAKRIGLKNEIQWYTLSTFIGLALFYVIYQILF